MKATIAVFCFLVLVAYAIAAADAKKSSGERCYMEPETGRCKARMTRFYYDKKEWTCKTFIYGGCGGNKNNFKTEEECQKACK
ncbi:kappaPI-actitoxin-Avd3d-like [Ixodes scapularis]|uniref:kappaPI-actitoxin-Avd3d-like n=1 Tax=Ixodes scapularis TaxID=6945 RepID=UPI001A9CFC65|nr:kappaPI-actitoxin-Avd3d-like [Ixodes scapularis]